MLNLTRNLIVVDTEWHDFVEPFEAYICEISCIIIEPGLKITNRLQQLIQPPIPITEIATKKHGITNEMVAGQPKWPEVASQFADLFSNCDFCGYNVNADVQVISAEMKRAEVSWNKQSIKFIDPYQIWCKRSPRSLSDAVRYFLGREATNAHRADADALDTFSVAMAQLFKWPDLPRTVEELHLMCFPPVEGRIDSEGKFIWKGDIPTFNFGKYEGKSLQEVYKINKGYFKFITKGKDFSDEVKEIAGQAIQGKFPQKEIVNDGNLSLS